MEKHVGGRAEPRPMGATPPWVPIVGAGVVLLTISLLLAGILGVPFRGLLPPDTEPQPRIHLETKNTSRFAGADAAEVGRAVANAVYPPGVPRPDIVIMYDPADWAAALAAARNRETMRCPACGAKSIR